ncbi:MAG: CHAP domain-containing protein [Candidatus Dormibacteria bacterium]
MRGAHLLGRVGVAVGVAGSIWVSSILVPGPGAAAQQSTDAANQQALTSLLQQLESQGEVADAASVKLLLAKIQGNESQLASLNKQLGQDQTTQQVLQVQVAADRRALVNLVSTAYVDGSGGAEVARALSSSDMTQFFESTTLPSAISSQVAGMVSSIQQDQRTLSQAQQQLLRDESAAQVLQGQLGVQSGELLAELIHPVAATVTTGDWAFAFGTCTYWAAGQWRANGWDVNWGGDADQWWANAAAAGHAEGSTPLVGSIVVWGSGAGGASSLGHVAYVTQVGVPGPGYPNNFEVSEMNYYGSGGGFDRVDYRVVADGSGYDGFIYPPTRAA